MAAKLASNTSKEWSGTHDELKKKEAKIDKAIHYILEKHRQADTQMRDEDVVTRELKQKEKLDRASHKIDPFLKTHEDPKGVSGKVVKSNITDNDSAKIEISRGVIQGYTDGVAVDAQHQVIVQAQTYGQGQVYVPVAGRREIIEKHPHPVHALNLWSDTMTHTSSQTPLSN